MQVLAFDTSLDKTYITLALQDMSSETSTFISKKISNSSQKYHSVYLTSQIKKILDDNIIEMKNLDGIGVGIGPGSFTGIRVGLSVAKTIAQQLNLRLIGVSSCEILSKVFLAKGHTCPVVMDAKREMFYTYNPEKKERIHLFRKDEMGEFFSELDKNKPIICDNSSGNLIAEAGYKAVSYEENSFDLGQILAGITIAKLKSISSISQCHWSVVKPLYIQTPPVMDKK